jgi:hypothetical protein
MPDPEMIGARSAFSGSLGARHWEAQRADPLARPGMTLSCQSVVTIARNFR